MTKAISFLRVSSILPSCAAAVAAAAFTVVAAAAFTVAAAAFASIAACCALEAALLAWPADCTPRSQPRFASPQPRFARIIITYLYLLDHQLIGAPASRVLPLITFDHLMRQ